MSRASLHERRRLQRALAHLRLPLQEIDPLSVSELFPPWAYDPISRASHELNHGLPARISAAWPIDPTRRMSAR